MRSDSPPVKVAFCLDSFAIGGTELNAVRTAEALDPSRVALSVFHLRDDGPLRERYEKLRIPMQHIPIPNLRSLRTLRQGIDLAHRLRAGGFQVVHSHDIYCNIFAIPFGRLLTPCALIASRRWWYEAPRPGLVELNRIANRFAHRILANSTGVGKLLANAEGVHPGKVVMIPNFLSPNSFRTSDDDVLKQHRKDWGVPGDVFLVGIVARLSPVKNHPMLLKAIAQLPEHIHAAIIGDGPSRPELERLVAELKIGNRIHFAGEIVSTDNLHQFVDASILCSSSEGFPNTVIEAMAAKRPVIATPVGGVDDAIEDGVDGLIVSHNDVGALAKAIEQLAGDAAFLKRLGEAACGSAKIKFSQDAVIGQLTSLYESLALRNLPLPAKDANA